MNCIDAQSRLDELLDHQLDGVTASRLQEHLEDCAACRDQFEQARTLKAMLAEMPVPVLDGATSDRLIKGAERRGRQRVQRRWLPLGGALAAGLALLFMASILMTPPGDGALRQVTVALEQPEQVNLAINSKAAMDHVRFTVSLPDGVEMIGAPGRRVVSWEGRLRAGANLLSLPVVAHGSTGGQLEARVEQGDRSKTYRLRMQVAEAAENAA